jgi:dolichol-phosphate hexosyltransferase
MATQIIIAALNEENGIALTIKEFKRYLNNPRILVIDGKSKDNTAYVAKNAGAKVVFQKGIGKGNALAYGFKLIDKDVSYIVISDADYTYPAEHIPQMLKVLEEHPEVGMVSGNRFNSSFPLQGMKGIFHIGNRMIATVSSLLTGVILNDPLTGLRVIRADLLREWTPTSSNFDIEVELNSYIYNRGFEILELPISYRPRIGEKKLQAKHGITIMTRILNESLK